MKSSGKLVKGESPKEKFNLKQWYFGLPWFVFLVGSNAIILAGWWFLKHGGSAWIAHQFFTSNEFGKMIDPNNIPPLDGIHVPDTHHSHCGNIFKGESCHEHQK